MINGDGTITTEDLRRALEQRAEIDLVSANGCRITYDAYLQLFRVWDGGREYYSADDIVIATQSYNGLVSRK
jgi:hypothetical protein